MKNVQKVLNKILSGEQTKAMGGEKIVSVD